MLLISLVIDFVDGGCHTVSLLPLKLQKPSSSINPTPKDTLVQLSVCITLSNLLYTLFFIKYNTVKTMLKFQYYVH